MNSQELTNIEQRFPHEEHVFSAWYGSVVAGHASAEGEAAPSMLDLMIAVRSSVRFHTHNLDQNGSDYSRWAHWAGPRGIEQLQRVGGGLYYNPYVDIGAIGSGSQLKYGVISQEDLLADLTQWSLGAYSAGRLGKPCRITRSTPQIDQALQANLRNHFNTALAILPGEFTLEELFLTIIELSYIPDPRTLFGVDPGKVLKILRAPGADAKFRKMYLTHLEDGSGIGQEVTSGELQEAPLSSVRLQQDTDPSATRSILASLPQGVQRKLHEPRHLDKSDARGVRAVATAVKKAIRENATGRIVGQSLKGGLTSDKAWKYLGDKIARGRKARNGHYQ